MQLPEKDIRWRSHWLRQALPEDPDLAPPLEETTQADICIVGGGYLGLWTAIRLKEHNPGFDVVIVERDICGGGPSGRNSGMVLSAWTKYSALAALRDGNDALSIIKASEAAIGGIEAFCKAEAIDAWFDRIGWIWGATCEAQLGAWDDALNKLAAHGYVPARRVSRPEIAAMAGTTSHLGGAFDASSATVHPGFLVRGLRRAALNRGVRIYEKSPMKRFSRRGKLTVETAKGTVSCGKVVLAMNAWSGAIPELAPAIFNISSDDAMSQPIPDLLDKVGYRRAPLMIDSRVFVGGWSPTRDGRLSVGVSGGVIGFGGIVDQRFHGLSPRVAEMRRALRDGHPALADFPLETSWNGPIDRTVSGVPLFGALPANRDVVYGYGFSGNGTTMAYIGGEILTGLLTGGESELTHSALVRPVARGFPPEPFRFVGAHFVRGAVRRRDDLEHAGRKLDPVTRWLAGLAPSGVTPSKANLRAKKG